MSTWFEPASKRRRLFSGAVTALTLMAGGCASTPAPTDAVAASSAAIAQADRSGAAKLAPAEMEVARDKLEGAYRAMASKDYRHALWLAREAQVDAELAQIKAWSAQADGSSRAAP